MVLLNKFKFSNLLNIMPTFLSTCSTIFGKLALLRTSRMEGSSHTSLCGVG